MLILTGEKMGEPNQKMFDHFLNPRNIGIIENPDGYSQVINPVNGYRTDIYIRIENDKITDIKFKTVGCVVTVASASALTMIVKNKTLKEIVDNDHPLLMLLDLLKKELGDVPEKNWHCPPSVILSFFVALADYYQKNKDSDRIKKIENTLKEIQRFFDEELQKL